MLVAYDYSGSTGGSVFYHETTKKILQEYNGPVLLWDDKTILTTMKELAGINNRREGRGGTYPHVIAEHCIRNKYKGKLVVISDGQVSNSEIDRVDGLCRDWQPSEVVCHLVHTGTEPNMSISCPFTRTCPFEVYLHKEGKDSQLMTSVSAVELEAFALLDTIDSIKDFEVAYPALEKVVIARTMGKTGDGGLRDKLLALRNRLVASAAATAGEHGCAVDLAECLLVHDMTGALDAGRTMITEYYGVDESTTDPSTWSGKVSRLVAMCEGALRSAFGPAALSNQLQRARVAYAAPLAPLTDEQVEAPEGRFVCPVSHEEERDVVILLTRALDTTMFLADQDKSTIDDVLNCPLNMLRYPVLVERFASYFDSAMSLRSLRDNAYYYSPLTGKPIIGGLTLGACPEHVATTNTTLARTLTGGKLAGNPDLWFAVVWLLVRRGHPGTEHLQTALTHMDAHMNWRLRHNKTFASLSGLPEFVTTKIPLGAAAWYVFAASIMDLPAAREPLRAHLMHIDALRELVDFLGYELPPGVERHVLRLRVLLHMLNQVKKAPGRLQAAVLALHQNAYRMNPENVRKPVSDTESWFDWIPLDGKAAPDQIDAVMKTLPDFYQKLTPAELIGLAGMVDSSKSASDIPLSVSWNPEAEKAPIVDWAYGLAAQPPSQTQISPVTCRPLRYVGPQLWEEAATAHYGIPPSKMMSTVSRFALFVEKYEFYPTLDEFVLYLYNRYVVNGTKRTLPAKTLQFVNEVLAMYKECQQLEPTEFNRRFASSRNRDERGRLDGTAV